MASRIQFNPGFLECLDFFSPTFTAARALLIDPNTIEEQAIQI